MNKRLSVLSIAHNDLDGTSCHILLKHVHKDSESISVNYSEVLETLKNCKKYFHKYTYIVISDLVLTEETLSYLIYLCNTFPNTKFVWADHHFETENTLNVPSTKTSISVLDNLLVLYSSKYASVKILADYHSIDNKFIDAVNAFDMWNTDSMYFSDGMKYNSLFWNYGIKSFHSQFLYRYEFTERHDKDYNAIKKDVALYFKELETKKLVVSSDTITMIFGDRHQNWTQLKYKTKFIVQVFSFGKILLKINKSVTEEDCKDITRQVISAINTELISNIGGHHHILSFTHTGDKDYNTIIDYAKKIYNTLNTL
jgi:oligoribonuclease NrnB/cAMP/cGMP phosphodiesterase (DHH superfamily)